MTDPSIRLAALGVVLATFIATPASAGEPPSAPAAKPAAAADGKAKAAEAKGKPGDAKPATAGEGKPAAPGEKGQDKADKAEKDGDKADKAAENANSGDDKKTGLARAEFRSGLRELRDELHDGKLKKEEVADRLAKLKETQKDRRTEHRKALKDKWGDTLAKPNAREELRHHARRLAFLNRALLLAETERKGKDKDKIVERIDKLIEKENTRHESAMERIKSGQPAATAAASATGETAPAAGTPGKPETAPAKASAATPAVPAAPAADKAKEGAK